MSKKIPAHATCVFKGEIFDVYQWQQELFDGSHATFECLKRRNTVVVIPMQGDTVFYAEQEQPGKPPFISLFGGRAENDEEALETAKRELLEETGLASDDWQQLYAVDLTSKLDWTIYYFVARNCQKVQEPQLDGGEKITLRTTSLDNFISEVIGNPRFAEKELQHRLYSAFNPAAATQLISQLKA